MVLHQKDSGCSDAVVRNTKHILVWIVQVGITDLTSAIQYRKIGWLGLDNYFDLVVTSEDAGGDKVSGFPEKLLARLLDDSNPVGWSIGDQDWDHLFSGSTDFFQKVNHSKSTTCSEGKKKFHTFNQMIEILQEAEKR